MSSEILPDWWSADDADDESLAQDLLANKAAAAATQSFFLDDGRAGMPTHKDKPGDREGVELQNIDAAIARIEAELKAKGLNPECLEAGQDDDDEKKRKKLMTLADLPPEPLFLFGEQAPSSPRPDAVVDTGRRLKDGAPFISLRAPALGLTQPLYIHDVITPCIFVAGVLVLVFLYVTTQQRRMARKLQAAEARIAEERGHARVLLEAVLAAGRAPRQPAV